MNVKPNRVSPPATVTITPPQVHRPRSYGWVCFIAAAVSTSGWWAWDRFARFTAEAVVVADEVTVASTCTGLIEGMRVVEDVAYTGGLPAFTVRDQASRDEMARLELQLKLIESRLNERIATHNAKREEYLYARDEHLALVRDQMEKARLDLAHVQQQITRLSSRLPAFESEFERLQNARNHGAAAPQELEEAWADVVSARGELDALNEGLVATLTRVDTLRQAQRLPIPSGPDLDQIVDPLKQESELVRRRMQQVDRDLANQTVKLPAPGVVRRIMHRPGEFVRLGDPVLVVQAPSSVRLMAFMEQRLLSQVREGERVKVVSSYAPTVHGRIRRVMPGLEQGPASIAGRLPEGTPLLPVEIELDTAGRELLIPGSTVRIYSASSHDGKNGQRLALTTRRTP